MDAMLEDNPLVFNHILVIIWRFRKMQVKYSVFLEFKKKY